jgi:2-oxoglutarate dehydrogenase E2 component (dihydrolipoamide succinyltransferase)
VAVGAVVCLIDTEGAEGSDKSEGSTEVAQRLLLLKRQSSSAPAPTPAAALRLRHASGTPSPAARKILDEKI